MKILERIFVFYLSFLQASIHPFNKPYVVPCPTSGLCFYYRFASIDVIRRLPLLCYEALCLLGITNLILPSSDLGFLDSPFATLGLEPQSN